jgi:hypothetical protein
MLYREIIHTKHINTLCGQNVELLNDWWIGWREEWRGTKGKEKK